LYGARYFGTDGIRGRANRVITPELALKVGQAAGLVFRNGDHKHRVLIGKDTRLSGYMIETALVAGFTSVGMDVLLTGPIPTPAIGMLARSMRADLGVMISASHNPFDDNGIKLFGPDVQATTRPKARSKNVDSISARTSPKATTSGAPSASMVCRIDIEFLHHHPRQCRSSLRVVDCAHGAAYKVVPEALWELGADVIAIGVEPDGFNINKECGSTAPDALCRKVREMRADIGIALDGDADRVLIVDERGHVVDGDQLLAVIAESWKEDGRLQRPGVVATVMSNLGLERHLGSLGLELVRTPVGDRNRANADSWLQRRWRTLWLHQFLVLYDDRRWVDCRLAGAGGGQARQQAGVGTLPPLRAVAPDPQECSISEGQAARRRTSALGYRKRRTQAWARRPPDRASLGNRTGHPRMGEGDDRSLVESVVDDVVEALSEVAA
jgi:phosphoglucosamine mutase